MRCLAIIIWALLATMAPAQTVAVASGEHADFSRLVLTMPAAGEWRLGRTATGYVLDLGFDAPRYDVSKVFDLIPRTRLTGIFGDPATGHLKLTLGCTCHAIAFGLDAQTIVIDLRDGAPPVGSAFELSLDGALQTPLVRTASSPRPMLRPVANAAEFSPAGAAPIAQYDLIALPQMPSPVFPAFVVPKASENLGELQQAIVAQLAEGAARGVIDLALPPATPRPPPFLPLPDQAQVRLTTTPGLQVGTARLDAPEMAPDGAACIPDDQLNLASWGHADDVPGQLAAARVGLVGEFDAPQPDAVAKAIKLHLFLGFGAETMTLLDAMPVTTEDQALWRGMAIIVDGDLPDATVFAGMEGCDTAAAMWAILAASPAEKGAANMAAVARTFSALPAHLRLSLGPPLVDRLLARNAASTVRVITDAMGRGRAEAAPETLLAEAELDLENGHAGAATNRAETALAAGGPSAAKAMVTLVEARTAAGAPIDPEVTAALAAMLAEHQNDPLAADLSRAYQLALAGSGQFELAFASAHDGRVAPEVWQRLAMDGTDDDVLLFASAPPPFPVPSEAAVLLAGRLQGLGFNDLSAAWHLAQTPSAEGADPTQQPERSADVAPPDRSDRWQQNWGAVAGSDDGAWTALAQKVTAVGATASDAGPLAEATRLVGESAATRALIGQLLPPGDRQGG